MLLEGQGQTLQAPGALQQNQRVLQDEEQTLRPLEVQASQTNHRSPEHEEQTRRTQESQVQTLKP